MKPYYILHYCDWKYSISQYYRILRMKLAMVLMSGFFLLTCFKTVQARCPTVVAVMVDACGTEQLNEFIIIHSGGGFNTSQLKLDYHANNNNDVNTNNGNIGATPCGISIGNTGAYTGCSNLVAVGAGPVNGASTLAAAGAAKLSDLEASDYTVVVTDANGCTQTSSFTITRPVCNLTLSATGTNPLCNVASNGSIALTVTGGTGTLTFDWSVNALDGIQNPTDLAAGVYSVTVTDGAGCQANTSVTLTAPAALVLVCAQQNPVPPIGGSDGSATVQISGGTEGYTIAWSGPTSGSQNQATAGTATISDLEAGTYWVVVTDANGCMQTCWFTIVSPNCNLTATAVGTNPGCNDVATGSIALTVTGGLGNLTFDWNDNLLDGIQNPSELIAGTYSVTVTDGAGCQASTSVILTASSITVVPPVTTAPTITAPATPYCLGATYSFSTPGVPNAGVYFWTVNGNPAGSSQTTTITFPTSGTYTICITPSNVCHGDGPQTCTTVNVGNLALVTDPPVNICEGESYSVGGMVFTQAGTYNYNDVTPQGCVQPRRFTLNIRPNKVTNLPAFEFCSNVPQLVTVGGQIFSAPGSYSVPLQTSFGCDSIVNFDINVNNPDLTLLNEEICSPSGFTIGNQTFFSSSPPGNPHMVTLPNQYGCDSVIVLNLTVYQAQNITIRDTICQGEFYQLGNVFYNATGVYQDNVVGPGGCINQTTLRLSVSNPQRILSPTICAGQSVTVGNSTYNTTGTYVKVLPNASYLGCDSIVTINLTVLEPVLGNAVPAMIQCDNGDGTAHFNLSQLSQIIAEGDGNVFFFEDADRQVPILLPQQFISTSAVVYAHILSQDGCWSEPVPISLQVESGSFLPPISCVSTVCAGEIGLYTTPALGCDTYLWEVSPHGLILAGGTASDTFVVVRWLQGGEGLISLMLSGCPGASYCSLPNQQIVPVISDDLSIDGRTTVCPGEYTVYRLPPFQGADIIWEVSAFGEIIQGQGTSELLVRWGENALPDQNQWVRVQYESCFLGCGGGDTLNVTVLPRLYLSGRAEFCEGENPAYTLLQIGPNIATPSYWRVENSAGEQIWASADALDTLHLDFLTISDTYRITAIPSGNNPFCRDSISRRIRMAVPPPPLDSITGDSLVCPGRNSVFQGLSSEVDVDIRWEITTGNSNRVRFGPEINVDWDATPPYRIEATQAYRYGPRCFSPAIAFEPIPLDTFRIFGDTGLCPGTVGFYTASDTAQGEYRWEIIPSEAGVLLENDSSKISILWRSAGPATVRLSICEQRADFPVEIFQTPDLGLLHPETLCPGQIADVSAASSFSEYLWLNDLGDTLSTNLTAVLDTGFFQLITTDTHGCQQDTTFSIARRPLESIPIYTINNLCDHSGEPAIISTLESHNGFRYQWYLNDMPIGADTSVLVVVDTGFYYLQYTDQFGCQYQSNVLNLRCGGTVVSDTVCIAPAIHIEVDSLPGCLEYAFSTGFTVPPLSYSWSIQSPTGRLINGSFSNQSQFNYTFNEAGPWHVALYAEYPDAGEPSGVCPQSTHVRILIPIAASFETEGQCAGDTLKFIDRTKYLPNTSIQSWSWNFGDPGSGILNTDSVPNPLHVFSSTDTFSVSLTVVDTNGCVSTASQEMVVYPKSTALFEIPDIQCPGTPLSLQADTMQMHGATIYNWDITGPSSWMGSSSSTHAQIDSAGSYTVTLTAKNIYQCTALLSFPLWVPESITGSITALPDLAVCTGDSVLLAAPPGGTHWLWSNGSTQESLITETVGGFSVSVTDSLGCIYHFDEAVVDISHLPFFPIRAIDRDELGRPLGYTYDSLSVCEGEDIFLEAVIENGFSIRWSNGSPLPRIEFSEDRNSLLDTGEHDIFLEIRDINGVCSDTVFFHISVHPQPAAIAVTASPAAPRCEGEMATFSVQSPQADVLYIWNTGDTTTLISASTAGSYSVTAINAFGCEMKSDSLEIASAPNIVGFPTGCYTRCRPDTLCLPANLEANSFEWLRDGQLFSQDSFPEVNESGAYQLSAQNANGCAALSPTLQLDHYDGVSFVEGRVFLDMNDNGMIDLVDSLLSDIRILIAQPNGVQLQAVSIASGRYFVPFVPAGQYFLEVDSLSTGFPATAIPGRVDTVFIGCNQVYSFDWLLTPTCPSVFHSLSATICSGESYEWNGQNFNADTTLTQTFTNSQGCDSIVSLHLEVIEPVSASLAISICSGQTYSVGATQYSMAGVYRDTLMAMNGCDSIVTLTLSLLPIDTTVLSLQACDTMPVLYHGTEIPPGNTEMFVLTNQEGCDSIVMVSVLVSNPPDYNISVAPSCASTATGSAQMNQIGVADIQFYLPALQQTQSGSGSFGGLAPGVYPIEIRQNGIDCIFRDTFVVPAIPALEIGGSDGEMDCSGDSLVLLAPVLSGQTLQTTWLWDNGVTSDNRTVTAPGSYSVVVTNGCESQVRTFVVTISSLLTFAQVEPDTIIGCPDSIAIAANLPAGTFGVWESPQPISFGNPLLPSTFVYDLNGASAIAIWTLSTTACPEYSSDTVFISALPLLLANNDALILRADSSSVSGRVLDNDVIPGDQDVLFEILDNPFTNNTVWENGRLIFKRTRLLPEEVRIPYRICLAACPTYCDTAFLTILVEEPDFLIPNAITPNGDDVNDVLFFDFLHNRPDRYPDNAIIIFNRWGDIVFRAKPYLNNWGGTNQSGKLLPQATYYFVLYLDIGQGVIIESDVTVVR